jgi:hypothetical protein
VSFHHIIATKRHLKDVEIERHLVFESDSDCSTDDEAGSAQDMGYTDDDDEEELVQSSSSSSSFHHSSMAGRV